MNLLILFFITTQIAITLGVFALYYSSKPKFEERFLYFMAKYQQPVHLNPQLQHLIEPDEEELAELEAEKILKKEKLGEALNGKEVTYDDIMKNINKLV